MPYYVPVADTPEMQRVRENQKNFSNVSPEISKKNPKTIFISFLKKTVREFVQHKVDISHFPFSQLQYQSDLQNSKGKVTVVQDTPEILRVKENQKNFSSVWSPLSSLLSPKNTV